MDSLWDAAACVAAAETMLTLVLRRSPRLAAGVCIAAQTGPKPYKNSMRPARVAKNGGWHCSSFFDVEQHIRKIRNYAHREHSNEIDPAAIARRFDAGKDPYGRSAEYDCFQTDEHLSVSRPYLGF